ncbi:MAG: class I SAM-dependent methyltransferase [Candidatus Shapirobacteria bacterium]|nr:class I SAM-dependent methyltransferase [Candidatus Shapirobacteria bacterium]
MSPQDWEKIYEGETPHWVIDMVPSPLAKRLCEHLPNKSGNKILEIGVGNGRDSIYLAKMGNEIIGIDIAQGAVDLAKENSKKEGVEDKIQFQVGDAENLEFPDESFDTVYSISVLHGTILADSFKEIARVLKPGGKFMLHMYVMVKSGEEGKEKTYWFYKEEKVKEIAKGNQFIIEESHIGWDKKHKGEVTKILVMEMHKKEK